MPLPHSLFSSHASPDSVRPIPQPSLLTTLTYILRSAFSPPCPDCKCRIYTLRPGLSFQTAFELLFALGAVFGGAAMAIFLGERPWVAAGVAMVALAGIAGWIRVYVWGAAGVPARVVAGGHGGVAGGDDGDAGVPLYANADGDVEAGEAGTQPGGSGTRSDKGGIRVRVPKTLGLLAAEVLRSSAMVGQLAYALIWLPIPFWAGLFLAFGPAVFGAFAWAHWVKCEVLS